MLAVSFTVLSFHKAFRKLKIQNRIFKVSMSSVIPRAEFSRVINVDQIPEKRPVLCKLLAKVHTTNIFI